MKRLVFMFVAFLSLYAQAASEVVVKSKPTLATVFISGGAAVTRIGTAAVDKGRTILKIDDLPKSIDFTTLRVKVDEGSLVMSVKSDFVSNREQLDGDLKKVQRQIERQDSLARSIDVGLSVIKSRIEVLSKNSTFGPQGINDPNTEKAYAMYSKEIEKLKLEEYKVGLKLASVGAKKAEYIEQIKKLVKQKVENRPFALVEVESNVARQVNLEISYRVVNVNWFASYDLRTQSGVDNAEMLVKAKIIQNSGEDWNNVKLRLSNANASVIEYAPTLKSYNISYGSRPPRESSLVKSSGKVEGYVTSSEDGLPLIGAVVSVVGTTITALTSPDGYFSIHTGDANATLSIKYVGFKTQIVRSDQLPSNISMEPDVTEIEAVIVQGYGSSDDSHSVVNSLAGKVAGVKVVESKEPRINVINTTEVQNSVSMEIEIDGLTSVPSKQEPYSIDVASHSLPIFYAHVSSPRIEPAAFMQAKVLGMDKLTLLDGELNMFFDNTLINSSVLRSKDIADTTTFAITRDKRVVVRRDAVAGEPEHKIEGRKWVATRHWSYSVVNNGNAPIVLDLSDRVPVSESREIVVNTTYSIEPSTKVGGILTWRLELKPGESRQFGLKYVVSCPSNRTVYVD